MPDTAGRFCPAPRPARPSSCIIPTSVTVSSSSPCGVGERVVSHRLATRARFGRRRPRATASRIRSVTAANQRRVISMSADVVPSARWAPSAAACTPPVRAAGSGAPAGVLRPADVPTAPGQRGRGSFGRPGTGAGRRGSENHGCRPNWFFDTGSPVVRYQSTPCSTEARYRRSSGRTQANCAGLSGRSGIEPCRDRGRTVIVSDEPSPVPESILQDTIDGCSPPPPISRS